MVLVVVTATMMMVVVVVGCTHEHDIVVLLSGRRGSGSPVDATRMAFLRRINVTDDDDGGTLHVHKLQT